MLCWNRALISIALLTFLAPLTSYAEDLIIATGDFEFLHAPVNLDEPDGYCSDPPGLMLSVASEQFSGQLRIRRGNVTPSVPTQSLKFQGAGFASGCVYLPPVDGIAGQFAGSFTWQAPGGELSGTFFMLNFPTESPAIFGALIFITFDGGSGRFRNATGSAIAEGLDFPFGGLGDLGEYAGVAARITEGEIRLRN
jgi:hypothetical protein